MNSNWIEFELGEVVEMQTKKINANHISINNYISTENMLPDKGGITISSGLPQQNNYLEFKIGDVLFSNIRTYFKKVWRATFKGGASNDIIVFRSKNSQILNQSFLYYLISNDNFIDYTVTTAKGTKMPRGDREAMKKYKLRIPEDIEEQKRIVILLDSLNDKIANNNRINQALEAIAQALFKSWFVDFEPVKAKIQAIEEEKDPQLAAMSAISGKTEEELQQLPREKYNELAATADLFPDELVESELGKIPKGWKQSEIEKEVTIFGGATPSTAINEYWENGSFYWATPKDMSSLNDKILIDTQRKITKKGVDAISSGVLPKNTVLLSSRAPVGYLAISKVPVSINQGFIAMVCNKRLSPEYIIQWCSSEMQQVKSRASGTTFLEINKKNFRPIKMHLPKKNIISNYTQNVKLIYELIEVNLRENVNLSFLRDLLLPKLITGEIELR